MLDLLLPAPVYQKIIPARKEISNSSDDHLKIEIKARNGLNLDSL